MHRETPVEWAKTSTTEISNGTKQFMSINKKSRWEYNLLITSQRLQHVYKQMQEDSLDKLHLEKVCVTN